VHVKRYTGRKDKIYCRVYVHVQEFPAYCVSLLQSEKREVTTTDVKNFTDEEFIAMLKKFGMCFNVIIYLYPRKTKF